MGLEDESYTYSCTSSAPTVKRGETSVTVTREDATHYTFTMPDGDVTVTARFQISSYVLKQGNETSGAKLTYTVDVFNETASLTVADAWGNFDVTIPDTILYNNVNNWPVTDLSVSSDAFSGIATLTGGANVRTILGNLYSWQKETTRNFKTEGYYSFPGFESVVVPDTVAALDAIPAFISGHYDADGAYYVGKCLVRVDPDHEGGVEVKDGTICVLAGAFEGCTKLGAVTLPATVEFIGMRAFANSSVTSVNLPTGLKEHSNVIYTQTFYNCRSLTTVSFGEGVTLREIGYCAFTDCVKLEGFDFSRVNGNALNMLCFAGAFDPEEDVAISLYTGQLYSAPSQFAKSGVKSVTFLENTGAPYVSTCCFYNCKNLDTLTLSTSGMQLEACCFEGCTALTKDVLAQEDSGVYLLGYRCLARTGMIEATVPARLEGPPAGGVFADNPQLTTLNWRTTVHGSDLFFTVLNDCCDGGSSLYMSSTTASSHDSSYAKLPEKKGHTFITTLNLYGNAVSNISAFAGSEGPGYFSLQPYLETVNIHNTEELETWLPNYMFIFCPSLHTVSFDHPEKVMSIGNYALAFCPGLHSFPFEQMTGLQSINPQAFMLDSFGTDLNNSYSAAELAAWTENDARRGYGLTGELDLSKCTKLMNINGAAFEMQYHITGVKLPKNVHLASGAFVACSSLRELTADGAITNLGGGNLGSTFTVKKSLGSYKDCFGSEMSYGGVYNDVLETITVQNAGSVPGSFFARLTGLKTVTLTGVKTVTQTSESSIIYPGTFLQCISLETVNLPDAKEFCGGTPSVFYGCNNFTLSAPEVTTVGAYSLSMCALSSVDLPNAKTIGRSAFENKHDLAALKSVSLPKAETIGDYAFMFTALTNVELPEATSIGDGAFYGTSLKTVSAPKAKTVGRNAFQETALTSVSLPEATSVGEGVFYGCAALETASLPKATSFGKAAFANCDSLTSFTVPEGATALSWFMFAGCDKLESVSLPSTLTEVSWGAFKNTPKLTEITIPAAVKVIDDDAFAMYDMERDRPLAVTLAGAPEIKTSLTESEYEERYRQLVLKPDESDSEEIKARYAAIVALLPIPDGSSVVCESPAGYDAASAYQAAHAPALQLTAVWPELRITSVSGTTLTYELSNAPDNALLVAAWYDASGKLVGSATANAQASGTITVGGGAASYKLMLVNKTNFAPLCPADTRS